MLRLHKWLSAISRTKKRQDAIQRLTFSTRKVISLEEICRTGATNSHVTSTCIICAFPALLPMMAWHSSRSVTTCTRESHITRWARAGHCVCQPPSHGHEGFHSLGTHLAMGPWPCYCHTDAVAGLLNSSPCSLCCALFIQHSSVHNATPQHPQNALAGHVLSAVMVINTPNDHHFDVPHC